MTDAASGDLISLLSPNPLPASEATDAPALCRQIGEACQAWLMRSPSLDTRSNYGRDLPQFLEFVGMPPTVTSCSRRPARQVAGWRDHLGEAGSPTALFAAR